MNTESFWEIFAYFCFIVHTFCLVELVDIIYFKKLLLTSFLLTFAGCYYLNQKVYKLYHKKKMKEYYSWGILLLCGMDEVKKWNLAI